MPARENWWLQMAWRTGWIIVIPTTELISCRNAVDGRGFLKFELKCQIKHLPIVLTHNATYHTSHLTHQASQIRHHTFNSKTINKSCIKITQQITHHIQRITHHIYDMSNISQHTHYKSWITHKTAHRTSQITHHTEALFLPWSRAFFLQTVPLSSY